MALNILVYLAEYLAQNFLGMNTSEMNNEIPQYRSIVQEKGIVAGNTAAEVLLLTYSYLISSMKMRSL